MELMDPMQNRDGSTYGQNIVLDYFINMQMFQRVGDRPTRLQCFYIRNSAVPIVWCEISSLTFLFFAKLLLKSV